MEKTDHTFHYDQPFELESGESLPGFQLRYTTLGKINKERNNIIWVCHALTGSSDFTQWWQGLFSEDGPFNPNEHLIICANVLGGCYGSTGPLSIDPESGDQFFHDFPLITNRDVVRAFDLLRESLEINKIKTLIGGSLGGQQVLEWAIIQPELFDSIIPIACNAKHSPWGIAFNESQRMAIEADATWNERDERAGLSGLKAARAVGMLSYRNYQIFEQTQPEKSDAVLEDFRAASYQQYQGDKLTKRFNAFTYWRLSQMMDSHNVGRARKSEAEALSGIKADTLVIGIDSDFLFPIHEQQFIASQIGNSKFEVLPSLYGHDGFLVELEPLKEIIKKFLKQVEETV